MKRLAHGAALIEQVVVTVAVGAASVTALPGLTDVHAQAQRAALANLAAAGGTAMALNYGGCLVTDHATVPGKCMPMRNCNEVAQAWLTDVPPGYRIGDTPLVSTDGRLNGAEAVCTVTDDSTGNVAQFRGIAAGL